MNDYFSTTYSTYFNFANLKISYFSVLFNTIIYLFVFLHNKMMAMKRITYVILLLLLTSCLEQIDFYTGKGSDVKTQDDYSVYLYPYDKENHNVTAEITIQTDGNIDLDDITPQIPYLKYNKSWLFLLTQDDCKQVAYCCTWAAINGKPLSNEYFYSANQLKAGDLPPDIYYLGKTLGCTDGVGNEVRFNFTTTLAPEYEWMNKRAKVNKGYTKDYYRFFMSAGLNWDNVAELANYGVGIAFHDVNVEDVNNADTILKHYAIVQDSIRHEMSGRGCKFLAEPNGNKTYVTAAKMYSPIQIMTAQSGDLKTIYPFREETDLKKMLIKRIFYESPENVKTAIIEQLNLPIERRNAIHMGIHLTSSPWVDLLLWINDMYGKDGDDSVWFPSLEEYYEYNYYRIHSTIRKEIKGNELKLYVTLPSEGDFYYPSITVNLNHLTMQHVKTVSSGNMVTGLSYGDYADGMMLNIDCRKFLLQHATHFVEQYEEDKTNESNKTDAIYFVNMLKESEQKQQLLDRVK